MKVLISGDRVVPCCQNPRVDAAPFALISRGAKNSFFILLFPTERLCFWAKNAHVAFGL